MTSYATVRGVRWTKVKYQLFGLVFLVVLALFVTATVAAYKQAFTPVVHVTLETDHVGNQLDTGADVKVRGLIVGEVRSIRSTGSGAQLDLALAPDKVGLIPANVTAMFLPKTLFGERYVALQLPAYPSPRHLAAGDVISQDRTTAAIEIEKVLDDVMPLLQAVAPEKLAATLNALSSALAGRGKQLGDTLVTLQDYLRQVNPSLPTVDADITSLTSVANTYNAAAPQLLQALSEATTTTRTIVAEQTNLRMLYGTLTTSSLDLANFLQVNENNMINLVADGQPTLNVLARYAPEYPCFLQELVDQIPSSDKAYGKGTSHPDTMHVTIVVAASRGKYLPNVDTPRWNDDRGPRCYPKGTPTNRFPQYPPGGAVNDGSTHPPAGRTWNGDLSTLLSGSLSGTTSTQSAVIPSTSAPAATSASTVPLVANSPAEQQLIATLVAPTLEVMPQNVPDWASVLVGPLFRGAEVTAK